LEQFILFPAFINDLISRFFVSGTLGVQPVNAQVQPTDEPTLPENGIAIYAGPVAARVAYNELVGVDQFLYHSAYCTGSGYLEIILLEDMTYEAYYSGVNFTTDGQDGEKMVDYGMS